MLDFYFVRNKKEIWTDIDDLSHWPFIVLGEKEEKSGRSVYLLEFCIKKKEICHKHIFYYI